MTRLKHAAVALVATLLAYQAYVLAIVPIVEPTLVVRPYDPASEEEWGDGRQAVARWQKVLESYLPPGHWALSGTPQVFEYDPLVLVLDDFLPNDRGEVELTKCVLLAFPTPRRPGEAPPRDAIVVEAPDRVSIVFDKLDPGLDFSGGKVGQPIAGRFPGEIVIRSDMREPGPQDDLRIVTRDLQFNQAMLHTRAEVDLRLGPHRGSGRELEVRFLREQRPSAKNPVAGVESLELREGVRLSVDTGALPRGGGSQPARVAVGPAGSGVRLAAAEFPVGGEGPLELTSAGPFRFDFTRFIASFSDDVRATLGRDGGQADRLFCRELRVHFADGRGRDPAIDPRDEPDLGDRQRDTLGGLRPTLVEAVGEPVRLESAARQAAVRGQVVRMWLDQRRLRIEGSPASLAQGLSEAQAPLLEYALPAPGTGAVLGEFLAAGPGWMRLTPKADRTDRTFQARWRAAADGQAAVRLTRDARGEPLLTIGEHPEFSAGGLGKLRAERVEVRLTEVAADGPDGPAVELGDSGAVLPRRIDASGEVQFVGRQVAGSADTLVAMFRAVEPVAPPPAGGPVLAQPVAAVGSEAPQDGPPTLAADDATRGAGGYRLQTRAIQVEIGYVGPRATPLSLVCDGGVRITEQPRGDGREPLRIEGAQLRADRLDRRGGARLTLAGAADANEPDGLAEVTAQGMRVWVRDLHVDQGAGRAWTEGRGDARVVLPPRRGELVAGGEATLRWAGGMDFQGDLLTVRDNVFAETAEGWLNCATLAARFNRPFDLTGGAPAGADELDVRAVECGGGVTIDYRSSDDAGQRSHERVRLGRLAIDRPSGDIAGDGPGSIRSVRLGGSGVGLPRAAQSPAPTAEGLRFLRVDFRDALLGNLNERSARFRGGVQAVYGPVLAWEQQLPLRSPEGVPPDSVELRCEELRVHEDPAASVQRGSQATGPLGPVELHALENVRIEATLGEKGGALVAEGASASYAQAADRLDLAGDARQLARLWVRPDATQPFTPTTVGRLTHYPSLGRTKVQDVRGIEYTPPASAAAPGAPLR